MGAIAPQITGISIGLLNRFFRLRPKKTWKFCVTGLCDGNSPVWPMNSPHKRPVMRKMFPFDDVIMERAVLHSLVQYIMQHCNGINYNQTFISRMTSNISPSHASYGESIVRILEKINRVITALHWIYFNNSIPCLYLISAADEGN